MPAPLRILVAEDNFDDAALLRVAFAKAGVRATMNVVHDGGQVLDYLQGRPPFQNSVENPLPTLLFLDLKMPRMDGFEVLEWLRKDPHFRLLPVVVFSGSNQPVDIERAYQLGAAHYLVKPNRLDELVQMVRDLAKYWRRLHPREDTLPDRIPVVHMD